MDTERIYPGFFSHPVEWVSPAQSRTFTGALDAYWISSPLIGCVVHFELLPDQCSIRAFVSPATARHLVSLASSFDEVVDLALKKFIADRYITCRPVNG